MTDRRDPHDMPVSEFLAQVVIYLGRARTGDVVLTPDALRLLHTGIAASAERVRRLEDELAGQVAADLVSAEIGDVPEPVRIAVDSPRSSLRTASAEAAATLVAFAREGGPPAPVRSSAVVVPLFPTGGRRG